MARRKRTEGGKPSKFMDSMRKAHGAPPERNQTPRFVTGSLAFNHATGLGGAPLGQYFLVYGPFHGGKSTLCAAMMADCAQTGGAALFLDVERAAVLAWFRQAGCEGWMYAYKRPRTQEETFDVLGDFLRKAKEARAAGDIEPDAPVLALVDSVTKLIPADKLSGKVGAKDHGLSANLVADWMKTGIVLAEEARALVGLVSQERRDRKGVWLGGRAAWPGAPEYYLTRPTNGDSLLFDSPVILRAEKGAVLKEGDTKVGRVHRIRTMRTKFGADTFSGHKALSWFTTTDEADGGPGVDRVRETISAGIDLGVLRKQKGKARIEATYDAGLSWPGEAKARRAFREDRDLYGDVWQRCQDVIDAAARDRGHVLED